MDARRWVWTTLIILTSATLAEAADVSHRTTNFVVNAPTQEVARQVAETAEYWREELAMQWLGKTLPNWYEPCKVKVHLDRPGAGGATTFSFEGGEVFGWNMSVQGSLERILDSVIPHEVSHTIFACYFRRPLPRWADEGAATLIEHQSERHRQVEILDQVIREHRRIPLSQLLEIDEYPKDMQQVLALYAEGYSLANFLVQQRGEQGRATYLAFLGDALSGGWEQSFRKHYGFKSLQDLDQQWSGWVTAGSPPIKRPDGSMLAQAQAATENVAIKVPLTNAAPTPLPEAITIRGQSEEPRMLPRFSRQIRPAKAESTEMANEQPDIVPAVHSSTPLPPTRRAPVATAGHSAAPPRPRMSIELEPAESVGE